jgi:hypothetical protein
VGGKLGDAGLVQGYESIDLLVNIKIFYQTLPEEVIEIPQTAAEILNVLLAYFRFALFNNDERTDKTTTIRSYVNSILLVIDIN